MKKIKKFNLFFFVIIIAIFFRFYHLSFAPPSVSLDEASIGYNAYSILKTGADEYGNKFPILLRAYDDWRPALYVYLVMPFVQLFDLTAFAVRLPSVILSVITVIAVYFLTKELFKNSLKISEVAMLLLAISPWHIYISRLGHEVNLSLSFWIFGLLFFFKGINKNTEKFNWKKVCYYSISALFFAISFGSYQSAKLFIPIMVLILIVLYHKELFARKKEIILPFVIGVVFLLPTVLSSFEPNALIRLQGTNIFAVEKNRYYQESLLLKKAKEDGDIIGEIVHNRRILTTRIFFEQYISHFNYKWLFANSGKENHKTSGVGLFYSWEAVFILLGFLVFFKEKIPLKIKLFLIFWIAVAPLSSAITTDAPHAMRTYSVLPAPQIIEAYGIYYIFSLFKKYSKLIYTLFYLIMIGTIFYFARHYFFIFPKKESSSFQYALYQAVPFVLSCENRYNRIVFSNKDNLYQSYMFFLFYSRYDPKKYQMQDGTISGGFAKTHAFDKYEFRSIAYDIEKEKSLLIGNKSDFPKDKKPLAVFKDLDGKEAIAAVER
ncbi:MAG: glycosyltransferase family 39 protein [Candidatus Levyibacteriota bacterium]|nr:MAG: glycosyltransferase family 39 protein [Candidatus Levybacteria bacterium]